MKLASYLESTQSKKAAEKIVEKGRGLGCFLFLSGLAYLLMLANENFNLSNFFDENALMAGLVKREFADVNSLSYYTQVLSDAVHDEASYMATLEREFAAMGLEVYSQNFSATKPVSLYSESVDVHGRNMYAIMRAKRAPNTESLVLSTPFQPDMVGNIYGMATMLSLAKYFKSKNYWAKDLIFLVTSKQEIGMQAWVDQYMGLPPASGKFGMVYGDLLGRSGAIQAAIHLELPSRDITHVNILIEGQNGALPNLDLVNLVVYLCHTEKIKPSFHDYWDWVETAPLIDLNHLMSLYTVLAMGVHQAPGLPLGPHAPFIKHRIDSLTIKGVRDPRKVVRGSFSFWDMVNIGRALEGTFRSMNNLLEMLHHSEFFYFTAASWRFISIGRYMPLHGLLISPLILEALSQWLQARSPAPHHIQPGLPPSPPTFPFRVIVQLLVWSYASGLVLICSVLLACHLWPPLSPHGVFLSLLLPITLSILTPLLLWRSRVSGADWRMAKFFSCMLMLLTLMPLGMLNFSLAFTISLLLTLPVVMATPYLQNKSKLAHILQQLLFLLLSPPSLLLLLASLYLYFLLPSSSSFTESLVGGADLLLLGLAPAVNAWLLLDCWLFPLMCVGVWPLWLMSWTLTCQCETSPEKQHRD